MKNYLSICFLLFLCAACGKGWQPDDDKGVIPPEGTSVTMMTYNIYGARATDPSNAADLAALAEVIRAQDPDFVVLQEVDVFTNRTGKEVHQARDLGALTGMFWHFTKAIDVSGGQYGDAVLSKHEILETYGYHLSVSPEQTGENRSVCMIRTEVDGKTLYVASTHLDHLASETSRLFQANQLAGIVAGIDGDLLIGGDFNSLPESETMSIIKRFLTPGIRTGFQFTFPSDNPNRTLDYILYKPSENISVQNYRVIRAKASDHCPVVATLKIKK